MMACKCAATGSSPCCSGAERLKLNGKKAHSTQKPEPCSIALSSLQQSGDIVLDPFFGSGTTGAVAKKLHRHWIGIEFDQTYLEIAQKRLERIIPRRTPTKSLTWAIRNGFEAHPIRQPCWRTACSNPVRSYTSRLIAPELPTSNPTAT